jgi:hypothetical protein
VTHDIELERMIGTSAAPASHPSVERVDGWRPASNLASLADVVLQDVVLLRAALYAAAEGLEAAS